MAQPRSFALVGELSCRLLVPTRSDEAGFQDWEEVNHPGWTVRSRENVETSHESLISLSLLRIMQTV